jgi:hypothetical protein
MPLTQRQFSEILRQSYPDAFHRAMHPEDASHPAQRRSSDRDPEWGLPNVYADPVDRAGAAVNQIVSNWDRLRTGDQLLLTQLASSEAPLADVYNVQNYRMNQTMVTEMPTRDVSGNVSKGKVLIWGNVERWDPYLEPPGQDRAQRQNQESAARTRVNDILNNSTVWKTAAQQDMARFTEAQPPAGSPRPAGAQDAPRATTTRDSGKSGPQQGI